MSDKNLKNKTKTSSETKTHPPSDNLKKIEQERDEYLDGWKRAKAELINYKNDELKRINEIIRFAGEDIVREMVEILDSFDLCISSLADSDQSTAKGIHMIRTQMEDTLKKRGLERIIVSVGNQFDPSLHEAISVIESDKPSGTVIEEIEKGYMWNGKLLRPSRVVVSK
jgi:molecular chaperone GrpE